MGVRIEGNSLVFSFENVHKDAGCSVNFQRTLRIPDDENTYALPPGLGNFPIQAVEEFANAPSKFKEHGGFMFPMYQSEAMWMSFNNYNGYPIALKIAAGSINAVDGNTIEDGLNSNGEQDYCAIPGQPWLDGFCVEKGKIRQFIAMPLGGGFTAEEQITGESHFGGLQFIAYALKKEKWDEICQHRDVLRCASTKGGAFASPGVSPYITDYSEVYACATSSMDMLDCVGMESAAMGFGAGGAMKQDIYKDDYTIDDYDLDNPVVCHVNLCNSEAWSLITGVMPPYPAPTAQDYSRARLPWFDYYSEKHAVDGSATLAGVKSVNEILLDQGADPLPNNEPVTPGMVVTKIDPDIQYPGVVVPAYKAQA